MSAEGTFAVGRVEVALPAGWEPAPSSGGGALVALTVAEPPHVLTVTASSDDPEPPDAPLAQLVAGLFLDPALGYEAQGPLQQIDVPGFDEAWQAAGHATLTTLAGRPLDGPQRCHLLHVVLAGPGDQRTLVRIVRPLAAHDPALDEAVLRGLRPTAGLAAGPDGSGPGAQGDDRSSP